MIPSRPRTRSAWLWTSLLLLAALAVPAAASAQNGTITGTVTNSVTGAPIAGVPVFIVNSNNLSDAGAAATETNASGVYTFSGPAGGYYLAAVPSEEGLDFVDEIFGGPRAPIDFPDLLEGTLVTIAPGGTATANLALLPAGRVTGTVTDAATGAPLANVLVQSVYRYGGVSDYWLTDAMTDAAGRYEIRGLAPGQIFLITRNVNVPGYVDEYYDNNPCVGPCPDSSTQVPPPTPITIVSGVTVPGKDFALDPGGVISGRLTNAANGQPIANLTVSVNALVNGALRSMGSVQTDSSGVYRFGGLATGTYFAFTGVGNSGYMNELYDNILCPLGCNNVQSGAEIPVTVGNTTGNRDFQLDNTGGVITGTVTRATNGAPIQSVTVTAVTRVGTSLLTRSATTNASGVYRLAGLPAGTYWLYTSNTSSWVNEIFNDIPCVGGGCNNTAAATLGSPIVVARGATVANQNFGLVDGGFVSGVVRNSVSAAPIAGQTVELSMQGGSGISFVTSRVSGPDGYFSFAGLTAGTYFLNTSGRTGYRNEIYNNVPCAGPTCTNLGAGTPIPVVLGGPVNGRDFNLDPIQGGVRGKITSSATGQPLRGISVNLYQKAGGAFVDTRTTDHNGNYLFDVAPTGTYVALTANTLGYRNEIYNDIPCTGTCSVSTAVSSGAAIDVGASGWTTGINFALDARTDPPGAPTNFRQTASGFTATFAWNAPASLTAGAPVSYVIDAGFAPGTTVVSLPAGSGTTFSIPNVPLGTFYLRVRAINANGSSTPSNEITLTMSPAGVAPPEAPTAVQAFMQDGLLTLTWNQPLRGGTAAGYIVEAGSATGLTNIGTVPVTGRSLTYSGVPPGFYFLRVRATNAGGVSAPSVEVMIVVGGVPSPPGAPNFTVSSATGSTVTLTWVAPSVGSPTSYIIEAGSATGLSNLAVVDTGSTATIASFPGVPPGTYYVRLRAVNALGASVVSNERTLTVQ